MRAGGNSIYQEIRKFVGEQGEWIFIVGCQRSGTTLTGQILGAHSSCLLVDEPDGLYSIFDAEFANNPLDDDSLASVLDTAKKKYTDIRKHRVGAAILSNHRLIAKAPNLTYDYGALSARNDRPIILYPVRDVRSVVASILDLTRVPIIQNQINRIFSYPELLKECFKDIQILNHSNTPEHIRAAIIWKIKTGLYRKFSEAGLSPHVFKYENMVANQLDCVTGIARCCDLVFEKEMLNYHEVLDGVGPGNTLRKRSIDTQSLSKWETQLTSEQVNDILDVGGELMIELGYENVCGRPA